jgi:hypothetical protein
MYVIEYQLSEKENATFWKKLTHIGLQIGGGEAERPPLLLCK